MKLVYQYIGKPCNFTPTTSSYRYVYEFFYFRLQVVLYPYYSGSEDMYMLKFGIRTVRTAGHQLLVNDKPFYCKGAGRHEDSDVSMLNISVINSPGTQLSSV